MVLAPKPEILGREVFSLLSRLKCAVRLSLVADKGHQRLTVLLSEAAPGHPARPSTTHIEIALGKSGDTRYQLNVVPVDGLEARGTINAIHRLVDGAVALESARQAELERHTLWPIDESFSKDSSVFHSRVMRELIASVEKAAATDFPILLTGETGVGKEVIAKEIHRRSSYAGGTFLPFNCNSVPREMIDSQLFGHKRGAFTGADADFLGVVRATENGTLFLDEIGELEIDVQPKLLRFLDTNEVHPLGATKPVHVDLRIIAATNASLERSVGEGRFREDLFHRLKVIQFHVPPLRERRDEIPVFAQLYLDRFAMKLRKPGLKISDQLLETLLQYSWPGNIRQLANEMRRVVALAPSGSMLDPSLLSEGVRSIRRDAPVSSPPFAGPTDLVLSLEQSLEDAVADVERAFIERALAKSKGSLERAAQMLGISRKGLFLKRRRHGLV